MDNAATLAIIARSLRSGWRTLTASPWRRAPLLGLRSPALLGAGVLAAGVLSLAAASGTLFLASAGTAALHAEAGRECPEAGEPGITDDRGPRAYPSAQQATALLPRVDARVRAALHGLPAPSLVAQAYVTVGHDSVTLFRRAGATQHVRLLSGTPGLLVPASFAAKRHLRAGSVLTTDAGRATVTGVYADLAPSAFDPQFRLPRYWCIWHDEIVPSPLNRPAPLLLVDAAALGRLSTTVTADWYPAVRIAAQTIPDARSGLASARAAAAELGPDFSLRSDLPYLLERAGRERAGLRGPVVPLELAGVAVAAGLVATSGVFWGVRRRQEVQLLSVRGVGGVALGVKAALELAPATVLGIAAGWLGALALTRAVGPSAQLEPGAPWHALGIAAGTGVLGLVLAGLVGARTVPESVTPDEGRHRMRRAPWELALLVLAGVAYLSVREVGAVRIVHGTVQIDPMVLAFPLLALTGATLLLGRACANALPRLRETGRSLPVPGYLALRRLVGSPVVAQGALLGVAFPVAVLLYAAALGGSTDANVQQKYETAVGAPHAFGTLARAGSTPDLAGHGTVVSRIQVDPRLDGTVPAEVMGVDPATFGRAAYGDVGPWTRRLAAAPHTPITAVLVNAPAGLQIDTLRIRSRALPVHVVGRTRSFPGLRNAYRPLLVVDRAALPSLLPPGTDRTEEIWTDAADETPALAALRRDGVAADYEITPDTFLDSTGLRPLTWIFGYLRSIAYLTGLVAVSGLVFALTARTRRRALAYRLALRMGMTRGQHRRSLAIELGSLVTAGWLVGAGLALAAIGLVYRLADPYPAAPPPPPFPSPGGALAWTAAAAALSALLGTLWLQRVLDRRPAAPLLRG